MNPDKDKPDYSQMYSHYKDIHQGIFESIINPLWATAKVLADQVIKKAMEK